MSRVVATLVYAVSSVSTSSTSPLFTLSTWRSSEAWRWLSLHSEDNIYCRSAHPLVSILSLAHTLCVLNSIVFHAFFAINHLSLNSIPLPARVLAILSTPRSVRRNASSRPWYRNFRKDTPLPAFSAKDIEIPPSTFTNSNVPLRSGRRRCASFRPNVQLSSEHRTHVQRHTSNGSASRTPPTRDSCCLVLPRVS